MAIYSLGSFIGGYFFGKLSDRYGRVPFLALGSVFNAFGYLLIIFAPVFWIFLLGRFVAGLAGGSIGVIQAYVSDISTPKDRSKNMGLIGAMFGLAFLVGPAIGGLLSGYGVVVIAGIGLITSFLNLVLIWVVLPEPRKHIQTK